MRFVLGVIGSCLVACSTDSHPTVDADATADADVVAPDTVAPDTAEPETTEPDTTEDAPSEVVEDVPPACPKALLTPGGDLAAEGWLVQREDPATLTSSADGVALATSTGAGETVGGQLLVYLPGALPTDAPFRLEVVVAVDRVAAHNALDSAAAILGAFTPPSGTPDERARMLYLDAGAVGWADDLASHAAPAGDGAFHTYVLAVDAAGAATVTVDGEAALTRPGFVSNGTVAIGDQTNEPGMDASLRLRSVTLLCP